MSESKPKLQILTRGCSKNRADTEHILAQISDRYNICPEEGLEDCYVDTVVVNTCGFIGDAKEESVNTMMEVVRRKNEGLVGRIVVFGCLGQRYASELPDVVAEGGE